MTGKNRQRAIFTNDAECDDMNSLAHLLLCANDIDIEGIVLSSSIYHYAGDPDAGLAPERWAGGDWMWDYLDAYEQVWPNLVRHDPDYPTADALRAVTCIGNVRCPGDMGEASAGSELIRRAILADDPRPVWLLAGGGTNTIGRALKTIEEEYEGTLQWEDVYRRVCQQARIFMIVTQDDTYRDYIAKAWPDLPMLHATSIRCVAFHFEDELCPPEAQRVLRGDWLKPHILDKGPLCARYHTWLDGHTYPGEIPQAQFGDPRMADPDYLGGHRPARGRYDMISEGDSPSFLHLIDTGLRQLEDPAWGGWGGRFAKDADNEFGGRAYWRSAVDAPCGKVGGEAWELSRWIADWMCDFACRAQWCVADTYEAGNHRPVVEVEEGRDLAAAPGQTVTLTARAWDPDGDELSFDWFDYPEAGSLGRHVAIEAQGGKATVTLPADARPGQTVHVVVRVRDRQGLDDPYLVAYRRVVITVG